MRRVHVFADEAGNFDFSRQGSRFFIITTVSMEDCSVGNELLALRRQLAWEKLDLHLEGFHASEDKQAIRDRVFDVLVASRFRVDCTILEKAKALPRLTEDHVRFYKQAWYLHFQYVGPRIAKADDEVLVVAASLGTKSRQRAFAEAVHDVVTQTIPTTAFHTTAWPARMDPCLWVADYCNWAVQRKWERQDERSFELIKNKLATTFEPFKFGKVTYY